MKKPLIILLLGALVLGCKNSGESGQAIPKSTLKTEERVTEVAGLMEKQCYACHGLSASESSRMAPPMIAIKMRYLQKYKDLDEFSDALWTFVQHPSRDKAIMRGAIEKFGLMPYQEYRENDIRSIAELLFEYEIETPDWFEAHWQKQHGVSNYQQKGEPLDRDGLAGESHGKTGLQIANSTQQVLGKNLMATVQKNGTMAALEFCNQRAYPLTDSMATLHHAIIKRVSDLPRNPMNMADQKELEIIQHYKKGLEDGKATDPIVKVVQDSIYFYAPIITNKKCLQCHGRPDIDIKPELMSILKRKYPEDKAIGYATNELRGIWSIRRRDSTRK